MLFVNSSTSQFQHSACLYDSVAGQKLKEIHSSGYSEVQLNHKNCQTIVKGALGIFAYFVEAISLQGELSRMWICSPRNQFAQRQAFILENLCTCLTQNGMIQELKTRTACTSLCRQQDSADAVNRAQKWCFIGALSHRAQQFILKYDI